MLIIIFLNN